MSYTTEVAVLEADLLQATVANGVTLLASETFALLGAVCWVGWVTRVVKSRWVVAWSLDADELVDCERY